MHFLAGIGLGLSQIQQVVDLEADRSVSHQAPDPQTCVLVNTKVDQDLEHGRPTPLRGPEICYHNEPLCLQDRVVSEGRTT
jgi:hypothetical protein